VRAIHCGIQYCVQGVREAIKNIKNYLKVKMGPSISKNNI